MKGIKPTDKKFEPVVVKEIKGIFFDEVKRFFENTTGLRTSL
jgi:hypothetical protein